MPRGRASRLHAGDFPNQSPATLHRLAPNTPIVPNPGTTKRAPPTQFTLPVLSLPREFRYPASYPSNLFHLTPSHLRVLAPSRLIFRRRFATRVPRARQGVPLQPNTARWFQEPAPSALILLPTPTGQDTSNSLPAPRERNTSSSLPAPTGRNTSSPRQRLGSNQRQNS